MKIEEELEKFILTKYKSIMQFAKEVNIPPPPPNTKLKKIPINARKPVFMPVYRVFYC